MADSTVVRLQGLPDSVERALSAFLTAARESLSDDLVAAVLFGSAAEGKLAPTSDVNLLLVLRAFVPERINKVRDAYLAAEAAVKLRAMFVLEDELAAAAELFAQKFADILRRHRIVFGKDVFASLAIPRAAEIFRLRQVLMNLVLRLRESYVGRGHRPEQVRAILADAFGPLRAACATLLELEGVPDPSIDRCARHGRRLIRHRRQRGCGAASADPRGRLSGNDRGRDAHASAGAQHADRSTRVTPDLSKTMFPFDLPGPEFLVFYLVFAVALIGGIYLLRRRHESGPIPSIGLSDPLLFACLRGGPKEAVRLATLGLIDRGILQVADRTITRSPGADPASVRRRLEQDVLRYFDTAGDIELVSSRPALLQVAADEYEFVLQRHRLIPDTEVKAARVRFLMIALAALIGVGAIKLMVALSAGRSNVGFLIVMMVVAVVVAVKVRGSYRTAAGESDLGSIRSMFSELQRRASEIKPGSGSRELLWLTALFGASALPASAFPFLQRLWPQPARSTTTYGCGGASCGGGCGGGGGGGGCGGCGS